MKNEHSRAKPFLAGTPDRVSENRAGQWRTLQQIARDPGFIAELRNEFSFREAADVERMDRREFTRLMGAALAMAGLSGCVRQPPESIVPYVNQPAGMVQGQPLFFATAIPYPVYAAGLLVKSHMGRPIKIEGNPRHPGSLGSTDPFAQASLLGLYDPDRSPAIRRQGQISSWPIFLSQFTAAMQQQESKQGAGLRLLTSSIISPVLGSQIQTLLSRFPAARWHQYEPVGRWNASAGAQQAFGRDVHTIYNIAQADVILSLGSDFLSCGVAAARCSRDFANRRASRTSSDRMNRLYAVESFPTNTGGSADHRLPLRDRDIGLFARAVAQRIGVPRVQAGGNPNERWAAAVAADLQKHRGSSIVIAGDEQAPAVHALAHAMNYFLGNSGKTVIYTNPVEINPVDTVQSLRDLTNDLNAGRVELLLILGGNPAYTAPIDFGFAEAITKALVSVRLGLYEDETSARCTWHVPQTHYLEEWSDALAFDGTAAIIQPLITPLYGGRSAHQILNAMLGSPEFEPYQLVRDYWRNRIQVADFERFWKQALFEGVIPSTTFSPVPVSVRADFALPPAEMRSGLEVVFRPDPTIWDGAFSNNGFLQELPKPITKLTWDNAALMNPAMARRLGVSNNAVVELQYRNRAVRAPVWIVPGHADGSVTLTLGYGRTHAGETGNGRGYNAYLLRSSDALWADSGLQVHPTGSVLKLASTQQSTALTGRYPVRLATLEHFRSHPDFAHHEPFEHTPAEELSLYPKWEYPEYKWGMSIDLNACVGCNACVIACQVENNVPIVGKQQVLNGREMHWLRIDTYHQGGESNPKTLFQPMLCVHCEKAPCEPVCPVAATVHSRDGLNQMVYNRCVGTRYCSNNCPYKVRRFNFLLWSDWYTESLALMRNPDVTVRSRGVMEKCTFCVQRIERATIQARLEDRRVRDGEIQTACAQACPAKAIVFGDMNDPTSELMRRKKQPLNYGLLAELNTRPRLTYLARVFNLNPELGEDVP